MTGGARACGRRTVGAARAFTLIELIAVLVVVSILSAVSIPALNATRATRIAVAARDVQRDLAWARQHAVATGTRTWVAFDAAADSWTVLAEDPSSPGLAGATAMTDPATGRSWTRSFSSVGLDGILSANFDGSSRVGFDWLGRPLNEAETDLAAQGSVSMIAGFGVVVEEETGLARMIEP